MYSEKLLDTVDTQVLIPHSEYVKKLKPLLPPEAFKPDSSKLILFFLNLGILGLGWSIIASIDYQPIYLLFVYLPLALIMGNSIVTLSFFSHDLMHGSIIKSSRFIYVIGFLGFLMLFMPPTQWKTLHNLVHHNNTNSLADPDRNYLYEQPNTWGKLIQNFFVPSPDFNLFLFLILGMPGSWLFHNFSNLSSILLFNKKSVDYVPAAFTVSKRDRGIIAIELLIMICLHFSILFFLNFDPLKIILGYFLPLAISHAGIMFYIYTNHLICRMTSVNDPLINSLSLRVPKIFDRLHLNFSYHTEHHIFPSLNSDYYPLVQELIQIHYPGRMNLVSAGEAWQLLMKTPRHYKDELTLTDYSGKISVSCPFNR
jgi:fatty acid desaturase